ncbi:MAG: squalene synthase HpnC [Ignavibacteria bacterium]|nr:squalene synthase HpnC [Ignavibacteria bacterium]
MNNQSLESSYQFCLNLAKKHYENFPVASILIPKEKRKFVAAVYAFARIADDIADEGNLSNEFKVTQLIKYKDIFVNKIITTEYPYLEAVYDTIQKNNLTEKNFINLIEAFIQDNQINKYKTFSEIFEYCSKSANPIGRILLELFDIRDNQALTHSDEICTALQLTNFYQDLSIDINRNRFYIAEEILNKFELTFDDLINFNQTKIINENFKWMMKYLLDVNYKLFQSGENLLKYLSGLFKFEIKLTINGGREILNKIKLVEYNTFLIRPTLKKFDWIKIILRGLV